MQCHNRNIPKRSSKDPNQIAAGILAAVTGEAEAQPTKNPSVVALAWIIHEPRRVADTLSGNFIVFMNNAG